MTRQAANYDNSHRETAAVVWSIDKFREFFVCNPYPTKIFTDNRVTSYIKSSKNSKLKRWRSYLDAHNIEIHHRPGSKMLVSDSLSRLTRNPKSGDYVPDVSDELLEEIIIATCSQKSKLSGIELFQVHVRNGHCGSDRLNKISGEPLDFCNRVIKQCIDCNQYGTVKTQKQILGTIKDPKEKNKIWFIDFVFFNNKKYLSAVDRSTRFCMLEQVDRRCHDGVIKALSHIFALAGRPEEIISDREFISSELQIFF